MQVLKPWRWIRRAPIKEGRWARIGEGREEIVTVYRDRLGLRLKAGHDFETHLYLYSDCLIPEGLPLIRTKSVK